MYKVIFTASSKKELEKIQKQERDKIIKKIDILKENPRPNGCKKLVGRKNEYRLRQGEYRIIYAIEDDILFVEIGKIKHRKNAYK